MKVPTELAPTASEKSLAREQFEFLLEHSSTPERLIAVVNNVEAHYGMEMTERGLPDETNPSDVRRKSHRGLNHSGTNPKLLNND
jgi:hypothetical protein